MLEKEEKHIKKVSKGEKEIKVGRTCQNNNKNDIKLHFSPLPKCTVKDDANKYRLEVN